MQIILFFGIITALMTLVYGYIVHRLVHGHQAQLLSRVKIWSLAAGLALTHSIVAFIPRLTQLESKWTDALQWFSYCILGLTALLFFLVLARDLFRLKLHLAEKLGIASPLPTNPERREILRKGLNWSLLGGAGFGSAVGFVQARTLAQIEKVEIDINGLDDRLRGLRIAQISDIHVGPTIKRDFLQSIVDQVNELKADFIAITGDLVDGSVGYLDIDIQPLAGLKAKHGTFFVTGNHEYYSGAIPWINHFRSLGIHVLNNEHHLLEHNGAPLVIAGVNDYRADRYIPEHRSDPEHALRGAPLNCTRILLAHQPRSVFAAAQCNVDLQLSGHTHGGQFMPWNFLVNLFQPYVQGLHFVRESRHPMWIYVNRGTGYWGPPNRLGIPAEISLLQLIRK